MKRHLWGRRFEWERTREIAVFATDDKLYNQKLIVIGEVEKMLGELLIRLDVDDGNLKHAEDLRVIQALLSNSVKGNKIDSDKFEEELDKARTRGRLPYGLMILIDKDRYEFYRPAGQPNPAIYGIGVPGGLVILRDTRKEAVRHELGHMLGIVSHCDQSSNCVMRWECPSQNFCKSCKGKLRTLWG